MSALTVTPVPWVSSAFGDGWKCVRQGNHGGPIIAKLCVNVPGNANLLAAAPDLLESIRLRHEYEALPADRGGSTGPKGMARQRWLDAEAAALVKAGAR